MSSSTPPSKATMRVCEEDVNVDQDDSSIDYSLDQAGGEEEEGHQRPRQSQSKVDQKRAPQTVPPNTPFNSLSAKQATQMMSMMGIGSRSISSSSGHGSPIHRQPNTRKAHTVRSVFDKENEGVLDQDDTEVSSTDKSATAQIRSIFSTTSNDDEDGRYHSEDDFTTTEAPPNSPLKTISLNKGKETESITKEWIPVAVDIESDVDRQSKLREIQWQLRFPDAHHE